MRALDQQCSSHQRAHCPPSRCSCSSGRQLSRGCSSSSSQQVRDANEQQRPAQPTQRPATNVHTTCSCCCMRTHACRFRGCHTPAASALGTQHGLSPSATAAEYRAVATRGMQCHHQQQQQQQEQPALQGVMAMVHPPLLAARQQQQLTPGRGTHHRRSSRSHRQHPNSRSSSSYQGLCSCESS